MPSRLRGVPIALALLAVSCAGPTQLAKISERELRAGQLERAYDYARRGVSKDPGNQAARRAMTAAAAAIVADHRARMLDLIAAQDTVAAARRGLALRDFRAGLAPYPIEAPLDSAFAAQTIQIRDAAAAIEYRLGDRAMYERRPKEAYRHFNDCAAIVAGYLDVWKRIETAREAAVTRIAILPFENDTDVPELARATAAAFCNEIAIHIGRKEFAFTELVSLDEIYASMTVRELESLSPEAAFRIADGVEADRIIVGRIHGLRTRSTSESFDHPIYHKVSRRDSSGRTIERYVESHFSGVSRERVVSLQYDFQVLDARSRASIASRAERAEAVARVAWTDFRAEGDCGDYVLYPPDMEKRDPDRVKMVTHRWKECFGDWGLESLLEESRRDRRRAHYEQRYRGEFRSSSRGHPTLLGELPDENELAYVALEKAWKPLVAVLNEIDLKD